MAEQFDFSRVTVPLGQLLFRKRNERWEDERANKVSQRKINEAIATAEAHGKAQSEAYRAQAEGYADRQKKLFDLQQAEEAKRLVELEAAANQRFLANLPVDPATNTVRRPDPAAIAKAAAEAKFLSRMMGQTGGSGVLSAEMENELRKKISDATLAQRLAEDETARLNAAIQDEANQIKAATEFGDDKYRFNPARLTGKPGKVPLLVSKDEILADELLRQAQKAKEELEAKKKSGGLIGAWTQFWNGPPIVTNAPSVKTIQLPPMR